MSSAYDRIEKRTASSESASPSPADPFASAPSAPEDDLPEALRVGGAAEIALVRAGKEKRTQDECELYDALCSDLNNIRADYKHPKAPFVPPAETKEERYRQALTYYDNYYNANPVLRLALAYHANLEKAINWLWDRGWEKYMEKPQVYDRLLGEFIPRILHDRVWNQVKSNAYLNGTNTTAAHDWEEYQRRLRVRRKRQITGLSTGFPELDRLIGGLPRLTFLGGSPAVGKTSFALALATGALRAHPDLAVLFYSLDMPKDVIFDRMVCHVSGLDSRSVCLNSEELNVSRLLTEAEKELSASILPRLRVLEREQLGRGKQEIVNALSKHKFELLQQSGAKQALYVIDYFQLLDVAKPAAAPIEADYQRIEVIQSIQSVSRTSQCPGGDSFLILSEVRKGESGRTQLALDDLLGSARITYSADCVLLLEQDREDSNSAPDIAPLLLTVAKGRDGMTRGKIHLTFEYNRYRFCERGNSGAVQTQLSGPQDQTGPRSASRGINPLAGGE